MNNCKIETITPVHVGSGVLFQKNTEFLQKGDYIGIIDEKKVLGIIGEEEINRWVNIIENKQPLLPYLKQRRPDLKLKDVCVRVMAVYSENINNAQSLKEQIHTGLGYPYIPGSSIKGGIRTAIFTSLVEKMPTSISEKLKNDRGKIDGSKISKELFGKDPNHDSMRFLQVGDAVFDKGSTDIMNVASMNYTFNSTSFNTSVAQLTEAIREDASTDFKLKIDLTKLNKNVQFGKIKTNVNFLHNEKTLFQTINAHTKKLLVTEAESWQEHSQFEIVENYIEMIERLAGQCDECGDNEFILRLGHGSGWTFMTGNWAKNEKLVEEDVWSSIVDKARPGNQQKYADYFFPKTRRMDEEGFLLGFVKVTKINE